MEQLAIGFALQIVRFFLDIVRDLYKSSKQNEK